MNKLFGKQKKKGSMELSVNAIVILVMAMAVLGIGLSLITGVIGSGKDKLNSYLDKMDLPNNADSENPLQNINSIKLKRNKETPIGASFYNGVGECTNGFNLTFICSETSFELTQSTAPIQVTQGEASKIGSILKINKSGTHICTAVVACTDSGTSVANTTTTSFLEVTS